MRIIRVLELNRNCSTTCSQWHLLEYQREVVSGLEHREIAALFACL